MTVKELQTLLLDRNPDAQVMIAQDPKGNKGQMVGSYRELALDGARGPVELFVLLPMAEGE